jgi:predicted SAM-dependent methyltransferase
MKINLVLPPGRHSWNVDEGWAYNLEQMNLLGEVRQATPETAEQLLDWAASAKADMILLMGGDHHLPFLHDTPRKRELWRRLKMPTVCFCYESILESRFPGSREKSESALNAFSHFVHNDEIDGSFFEKHQTPSIWLPQCVDHHHFHPPAQDKARKPLVYFRGKVDERYGYSQRRAVLDFLKQEQLLALVETEIAPAELMKGYQDHAFAINLSGNLGAYNVRTFEALASGCVLFQFLPENRPRNNKLFEHGKHLLNFNESDLPRLSALIRGIRSQPDQAARIAESGRQECLAHHTIEVRIRQIIDFVTESAHRSTRLHIGCGDNLLRGFRNVDCRSLTPFVLIDDAGKLSKVPEASCELIYACHVLEHFSYHTVESVLRNWVSKLKPSGRIYLSVPNFRHLAWKYLWHRKIEKVLPPLFGGQEYAENFHYIAFDKRNLSELMRKVGLVEVAPFKAAQFEFTANDCSRWPLSLNLSGRKP